MPHSITNAHARRLALRAQGLDGTWRPGRGVNGAGAIVERLGYVQIDTIAVIERAHEHILWTRQPSYRPSYLQRLMQDRRVFEYWTHAASYVPMMDYRYYGRRRRSYATGGRGADWLRDNRAVVDHVRERIRSEGALLAADFQDTRGRRGPWWDWKPAKAALEGLFDSGELMISERRGFQRVYDLAERVLPGDLDRTEPTADERARWAVHRTLDNLGVVDDWQMRIWNRNSDERHAAVEQLLEEGQIEPVEIRGDGGDPLYARPTDLQATARGRATRRVHLLSPFDNLVIRRRWVQRVFDFDYSIECYVPGPKRRYGYFCLPVLFGDRLVGRLDPKADRKAGVFIVRRLTLEPDVGDVDRLLSPLAESIWRFARFNGCDEVRVETVRPGKIKAPLRRALAEA
ncbi:MAG: crosslink repair DNA glycosylase YcaQ family protein [Candidatus Latescibacteria bacterium]|nr:crosslink repair DNA glycosylase YcaQ family protein [Candidatus Latescibacterota bacterium]